MDKGLLLSCTVDMLKLLTSLYTAGNINHKEYFETTEVKLPFLRSNLSMISDIAEQEEAVNLIKQCEALRKNRIESV